MKCSGRDRCALVALSAVLVIVGSFCMAVGFWDTGGVDPQFELYLVGIGLLDLVLGVILVSGVFVLGQRFPRGVHGVPAAHGQGVGTG